MRRRTKRKGGYFPPGNKQALKEAGKKGSLEGGLKVLTSLWKRGILPPALTSHFYMTWLAFENGNAMRAAKKMGQHRNTLILNFERKVRRPSTFKLRQSWRKVFRENKRKAFSDRVGLFCRREGVRPALSKAENRGLVNLWIMGFPRKVLLSHYVYWSMQEGRGLVETARRLGKSYRHLHRYRQYAVVPGFQAFKWLRPLGARRTDWIHRQGRRVKVVKKRHKKSA